MAGNPWPNRYAGMYNVNYAGLAGDPAAEKKAQDNANGWKMASSFAPIAGTLAGAGIGSLFGEPLAGAQMGQVGGQALGAAGNAYADSSLDDQRRKALHRQALLDAIAGLR